MADRELEVKQRIDEVAHLFAKAACIIEQAEDNLEWVFLVHKDWEDTYIKNHINQAAKSVAYVLGNLVAWYDEDKPKGDE